MKEHLIRLAKIVACAVLVIAVLMGAVLAKLSYAHRNARKEFNKIKVGMTVNEMMASFPAGYSRGSVNRKDRREACRDESGKVLAPETEVPTTVTPDMERGVTERCEPETVHITMWRDPGDGQVNAELTYPKHTPEYKLMTKGDFAHLLQSEFKGREYFVRFGYDTGTPQHISMRVIVGMDGKVKELVQPYGWD